ncbi:DUF6908 domain-containing protein [Mariprofundus ferrooxydans]|uniref:DUF6908 domain-containing protein n=1 Tax=Mariprofundus ferrooxydans TaxID=314344 RepID=UPI0006A70EBC|nr:hypothetical protein [Mariprofundus ferrooxydans]KON48499.1 hypothetical protein AL013_02385 [Mariprofundus ferrooxydans]
MTREERIYKRLLKIFPDLESMDIGGHRKIENEPYMPLSMDILADTEYGRIISIAHNYDQNGDLMADPDMQLLVSFKKKAVQAMTFQNDGLGIYQECLFFDNGKLMVQMSLLKSLNKFLDIWTKNLIAQGFAKAANTLEVCDAEG